MEKSGLFSHLGCPFDVDQPETPNAGDRGCRPEMLERVAFGRESRSAMADSSGHDCAYHDCLPAAGADRSTTRHVVECGHRRVGELARIDGRRLEEIEGDEFLRDIALARRGVDWNRP